MKRRWSPDELVEYWTLAPDELRLLANKTGPTRLGFALLLKFLHHEGRFPAHKHEVPGSAVAHVAKQVGVPPEDFLQYEWSGRTIEYHRAQIRAVLGFREATVQDGEELTAWLCQTELVHNHQPEHLRAALIAHCRAYRIEPPSPGQIDRILRAALHRFEQRLCATILERLSAATVVQMDALVRTGGTAETAGAARLSATAGEDGPAEGGDDGDDVGDPDDAPMVPRRSSRRRRRWLT